MTPFEMWLAGSVMLPDTYSRLITQLQTKSSESRLAKSVREATGIRPGAAFRRWYQSDATWNDLVEQGSDALGRLVESLVAESQRGRLRRSSFDRVAAETIVKATIRSFVASLDPAMSTAVADSRAALRHTEATTFVDTGIQSIHERLDASEHFDSRLEHIVPTAVPLLRSSSRGDIASKLVAALASSDPRGALEALLAAPPKWLQDPPGEIAWAIAEMASAYRLHDCAVRYFVVAGDLSPDRAYLYARAAAAVAEIDDAQAEQLLLAAARLGQSPAIDAQLAVRRSDAVGVRDAMTRSVATADAFLAMLYFQALRITEGDDAEIDFLVEATEAHPQHAGLQLELSRALAQRSNLRSSPSRAKDRQSAMELALRARDLRRAWRGDSATPVEHMCDLALSAGDFQGVVRFGREPPEGEALPSEASSATVKSAVVQALLAIGQPETAVAAAGDDDGFLGAYLNAEMLASSSDISAAVLAYEEAWQQARTPQEKMLVWFGAADAGAEPLPGQEELADRSDGLATCVNALLLVAKGRYTAAVELLRPHRDDERCVRMLAEIHERAGLVDEAVAELTDAAERFNDPLYLPRAVEVLVRAGRPAEAARKAADALPFLPASARNERARMHRVCVEYAGMSRAWREMAGRARAWIDDAGPDTVPRWLLVRALAQDGEREAAWLAMMDPPALQATNEVEAKVWVTLAAQCAPGPSTAESVIELVDRFPDDLELAERAVAVFFGQGDGAWGDVGNATVSRFQSLLNTLSSDGLVDDDDDRPFRRLSGDIEEMLGQMSPILQQRAEVLDELADRVRTGWPYGLLAAHAGVAYTTVLINRGAGFHIAYPILEDEAAEERINALAALGGKDVCLDVSTLALAWYVRDLWPQIIAPLGRLLLPSPAKHDVLAGRHEARLPTVGSIYFDTHMNAVQVSEHDPAQRARLVDHVQWMTNQLERATVLDWPALRSEQYASQANDETFVAWLSALDMAQATANPLWSDDIGLRTLARESGIPTFGTVALLEALVELGRIMDGDLRTALRKLREEWVVDLPTDERWLQLSAEAAEWQGGPACAYFSRPGNWRSPGRTREILRDLMFKAAVADPRLVGRWVQAGVCGIVRARVGDDAIAHVATVVGWGVLATRFQPEPVREIFRRSREECERVGLPSPTPPVIKGLFGALAQQVGPAEAARVLRDAGDELEPVDRAVMLDTLLGLDSL